jgi:hypothetical protein
MTQALAFLGFFAFQLALGTFIGKLIRAGNQRQCGTAQLGTLQYAPRRRNTTPTALTNK